MWQDELLDQKSILEHLSPFYHETLILLSSSIMGTDYRASLTRLPLSDDRVSCVCIWEHEKASLNSAG